MTILYVDVECDKGKGLTSFRCEVLQCIFSSDSLTIVPFNQNSGEGRIATYNNNSWHGTILSP